LHAYETRTFIFNTFSNHFLLLVGSGLGPKTGKSIACVHRAAGYSTFIHQQHQYFVRTPIGRVAPRRAGTWVHSSECPFAKGVFR
jgi:hypothetical protein